MLTRRQFIALGVAALMLGGMGASLPKLRRYRTQMLKARHQVGPRDETPIDPGIMQTLVAFTGALYGVTLDEADREELERRVEYSAVEDSGWRPEFAWLANYVDDQADALVGKRFSDTSPEDQDHLIQSMMSEPIRGRRHQMLALVSEQERQRRRFRISTLRQVRRIYQTSGVPWRRRGYHSWPGVPGDPRAYTRPGPDYA